MLTAVVDDVGSTVEHVVWMLFRPDRAMREAGTRVLARIKDPNTVELLVSECRGKADAAVRAAAATLFGLGLPEVESRLTRLASSSDAEVRDVARRLVGHAPATPALEPLLWRMVSEEAAAGRLPILHRLAEIKLTTTSLARWQRLADDEEPEVASLALRVLATRAPTHAVDEIVAQLPRADYATQQVLVEALSRVANGKGPEFADRLLPLMAAGDAGTRSAVLKILIAMDQRQEVIKRYLAFSKTLAGWARDRALESMKDFGDDLVEPTLDLLDDPDEEIRGLALVVAASFDDPRIIPAAIRLLADPDWWLRVIAADTLGRFNDPRAVDALIEGLGDDEARWAAVEALGRIGDARALPALARLLRDPAPEVRIEVLLALRNFDHPKILHAIHQVASSDDDRIVRARALDVAEEVAQRHDTEIADAEKLRAEALKVQAGDDEPKLHAYLVGTRNKGASDFHLAVGRPPMVRLAADLVPLDAPSFTAEQTVTLLHEILTEEQKRKLEDEQQLDLCYYIPRAGRYRANLFIDHQGLNAVFRVIPEQPPTMPELGIPSHLAEIASYHQGLVLVCGPAGSGKSTTLAALVNLFNETRHHHIITLEDPVEFVHPFKNCLVNQREVGEDTRSFARALRAALREDPDVIVIGDLRDNETVSLALTAAETGHIVLGTLSATSAPKAVDRMISSFSAVEQPQVRAALAESLKFVIAQRLLPVQGRRQRVACFEVLKGTPSVANLIREEKTVQLRSAMQIGRSQGMQTFDEALKQLMERRLISAESAYLHAQSKEEFEPLVSTEFLETKVLL